MNIIYKFCLYFLLVLGIAFYWPTGELGINKSNIQGVKICQDESEIHFVKGKTISENLYDADKYQNGRNLKVILSSIAPQQDSCLSGFETSIWYMGKHGLNWNKGFPAVDTGFSGYAGEAHTSICDRYGNLLFYTNNNEIYNSVHQVMDNGIIDSPFGFAGASSTMNLVLPQPGSDSLYWVFYPGQITDQTDTFAKKLRYAVIDMSQNGGLGKVIIKHQILMDTSSERVEGIRHCNGKDWWIIGQNAITEQFNVWLLNQNGLSLNGKMNSGVVNNIKPSFALVGYLKSSHSGALIAEATGGYDEVNRIFLNSIELHRFDPASGTIYGGIQLSLNLFNEFIYGADFSSNDTKLYFTSSKIWQIDLNVLDTTMINKSLVMISDQLGRNTGSPVLGPDGRIYLTTFFDGSGYLYTINKPNEKGLACDYQLNGFYLGEKSGIGAPHFAQGLQFPYRLSAHGPYEFCADTTVRYVLNDPCSHPDLQWQLPDGGVITSQNGDTIDVYFSNPGYKRVIAAYPTPCGYKSDTLKIQVNNCNCKPAFEWMQKDTLICSGTAARFKFRSNADSIFVNGNLLTSDSFVINALDWDTCLSVNIHFAEFCDSSLSLCIYTRKQAAIQRDSIWFCPGDTLYIASRPYVSDTLLPFTHQDQSGCDSISYLQLLTYPPVSSSKEHVWICPGDSVLIGQQWYKDSSDIVQIYLDRQGCDSIHTLHLRRYLAQQINVFDHTMCRGDSVWFAGQWYRDILQKELIYQDVHGCDSTWKLNIKYFTPSVPDTIVYQICPGDSVWVQGRWIYDTTRLESRFQNQFGCDSTLWSIIRYKQIPKEQNLEFSLCPGDSIYLTNQWVKAEMNWTIRKQNQGICDSVFNYRTKWYKDVEVDVWSEQVIEEGDSLTIDPFYSSNVRWVLWSPPNGLSCINCLKPKASPAKDTKYYVQASDDNGCTTIDSILIRVNKKEREPYVPNSFSPNGDNINDLWGPVLDEDRGSIEQIQVFDRWGNQLFECRNFGPNSKGCQPWDGSFEGKKCLPGVYVYQIIWRNASGILQKKVGDLSLIL